MSTRDHVRAELRELIPLALPIVLASVGQQLMGVVDTAMLGRYSESALAGAGIANAMILALQVLGMGAVMGLDTLVPQALGAGEADRARHLLAAGVRLAVVLGLPITAMAAATPLVYGAFGVEASVAADAEVYTYWRVAGVVPTLVATALKSYLAARAVTRPLVVATIVGNIVNVVLNYGLIFGVKPLGIPPLGVLGAAFATLAVTAAITVVFAWSVRALHAAGPALSSLPTGDEQRRIAHLGVPVGLQLAAEVGVFALVGLLAGRLGVLPAAGHQVALLLASMSFSVALGIAQATSVRVGLAVGRGDEHGTRVAGGAGLTAVLAYMAVSAVVLIAIPDLLARICTDDPAVVAMAASLIRIAAVFQLSDGAQAVGAGALRGAGDTRAAFVGNAIGHYAIGFPVAIALTFPAGLGAPGLWWGLTAGLTAVAIALWARFFWLARRPIARS